MLLQRLRSAEPTVEAAIAYNLVDLALSAPESAFVDIIRAFSAINRSANPEDPRFSNNMVQFNGLFYIDILNCVIGFGCSDEACSRIASPTRLLRHLPS